MYDFLAVGDVMVDASIDETAAPSPHPRGRIRLRPGGSAANAAVWAASVGARAGVVGRVGDDFAGRAIARELQRRNVEALLTVDRREATGTFARVNRSLVVDRGASAFLDADDLPRLAARAVLVSGFLLLQRSSQAGARAALERAEADWVAIDVASAHLVAATGSGRTVALARPASVLLANAEEARALTGSAPEQAARTLARDFRIVCVKLGPAGVVGALDGRLERASAPSGGSAVDVLGAGDAFAAGLLVALSSGHDFADSLVAACRLGAAVARLPSTWPPE